MRTLAMSMTKDKAKREAPKSKMEKPSPWKLTPKIGKFHGLSKEIRKQKRLLLAN